jgi:hypothetical protein
MPFFRTAGKICYFSHIPKTGGTSVEDYLIERFGSLAMLDRRFNFLPPAERWCQTSPQHIEWKSLQMILPLEFVDAVFAVVRHPIARIESGYHFQIQVEKSISPDTSFSDWLQDQVRMMKANPFALDNHMRPQVDFVPEGAAVFHLEFGLDPLVLYLDELAGNADGPRTIGHSNKSKKPRNTEVPAWTKPSRADIDLLCDLYREDFDRFGYEPEQKKPLVAKPALPQSFMDSRARELAHRASFSYRWNRRLKRWRAKLL